MMSIKDLYRRGRERLNSNFISSPGLEAALLLNKVTGHELIDVYVHPDKPVSDKEIEMYDELIEKRIAKEPIAYILGEKEFYSRMFSVNRNVLIPRPETELLLEEALKIISSIEHPVILDLGTGSGCIAITIMAQIQNALCLASDISLSALQTTNRNAARHNVNLELINADLLSVFKSNVIDVIVSNPPYISEKDFTKLEKDVKDFEPRQALVSGEEGLFVIKQVVSNSSKVLKSGGWVLIEIGYDQSQEVISLFHKNGFKSIESIKDVSGISRVIKAQWIN